MFRRRYLTATLVLIGFVCTAACSPPAQNLTIPTLAALPTETPSPTLTASPAYTATPVPTNTPNRLETQVAELAGTNAAAQETLSALLTLSAPTETPPATLTPTLTLTLTFPATTAPPQVVAMQPQVVYMRSAANLRTCASRVCEAITQLGQGEAVMATGTIEGEAIEPAHTIWFRVEYQGREAYVYSQLITLEPPSNLQPIIPPPGDVSPPISLPPSGGVCPSLSATCSQLTCDQAYACLAAGNRSLDRDGDGVPCESVCLGD